MENQRFGVGIFILTFAYF